MKMKKIFLVMALAIVSLATASAQLKIGVKAGMNTSTISGIKESFGDADELLEKAGVISLSTPYKVGFHVGITAQYLFTDALGIETGLFYSQMGGRKKAALLGETMVISTTLNPSYLQLPVQLLYKIDLGSGLALVPSAGMYVGYGLGGKVVYDAKASNSLIETGLKAGIELLGQPELFKPKSEGGRDMNRLDYGATFGLNVEYQKFTIGLGYDLGLARLNKEAALSGYKDLKNRNFKVSVGYLF